MFTLQCFLGYNPNNLLPLSTPNKDIIFMKPSIKISLLSTLILIALFSSFIQSQKSKVKVVYSYHVPDNGKMSYEMYSYLIADNELSFFVTQRSDFQKPENKVTQEADRIAVKVFNADEIGSYVVRDFKKESIVFREVGSKFMAPIIVSDQWVALPWNLSDETKKIGEYVCKKANCQFRGRSYTAWFAEEIPIPTGPWKLFGLPGLILEAYDTNMEFYAVAKELKVNIEANDEPMKLNNGTEANYSFEEYKRYRKNYKEVYINSIKSKFPRGMNLNIKPSDIKLSPIESEFDQ